MTGTLVEKKLRNYWGYNTLSFLRAGAALFAGQPARRLPHHGGAAARRRHRGDSRCRLQPHRRGQPSGPDAVVPRHRQRLLLLAEAGQSALLRRFHRLRQFAQSYPSAGSADGHGFAALLGRGHAMSTASGSTSPRRWRAGRTASTATAPSSTAIRQDPVLATVKLIAEPWDLGMGGYQVGGVSARNGRSGTTAIAARCGATGAAKAA